MYKSTNVTPVQMKRHIVSHHLFTLRAQTVSFCPPHKTAYAILKPHHFLVKPRSQIQNLANLHQLQTKIVETGDLLRSTYAAKRILGFMPKDKSLTGSEVRTTCPKLDHHLIEKKI